MGGARPAPPLLPRRKGRARRPGNPRTREVNGPNDWLLYGASGYTGRRIAEEARRRGLRPVLAGRDALKIKALADRLECPARVFPLRSARGDCGEPGRDSGGAELCRAVFRHRRADDGCLPGRGGALSRRHRRDRGHRGGSSPSRSGGDRRGEPDPGRRFRRGPE